MAKGKVVEQSGKGTFREAIQLTASQINVLQASTAFLPLEGQRTKSRVIQALIDDAISRKAIEGICRKAA